jgi:hypothetical protein
MVDGYTPEQLSLECGIEYSRVLELLTSLVDQVTVLMDTTFRGLNLISCPNIVPMYTSAVYKATCQTSVVGATWIFSCALLMAFFGMVCIMFRGAYYPIDYFYYSGADGSKSLYGTSESDDFGSDDGDGEGEVYKTNNDSNDAGDVVEDEPEKVPRTSSSKLPRTRSPSSYSPDDYRDVGLTDKNSLVQVDSGRKRRDRRPRY